VARVKSLAMGRRWKAASLHTMAKVFKNDLCR
jgi:hypothetical protein